MNYQGNSFGSIATQSQRNRIEDPPFFFFIMRLNIKVVVLFITTIAFFTIMVLWSFCAQEAGLSPDWRRPLDRTDSTFREIDCDINNEYVVGCRREGDQVYVPFSFLHKYFEVYGKLAAYDGVERFEWLHSYSKIYHPRGKYDPRGVFMSFENYNVEVRERVKCVSATEGVPVSTQWESQGYYYPTQIAQFGLSHYSKNLTESEPRMKVIEDGDKIMGGWEVAEGGGLERVANGDENKIVKFYTGELYSNAIRLRIEHVLDFIMSLNLLLNGNSSLVVVLQHRETDEVYNLHYITSDILITAQDNNVYHGIGASPAWKTLTRDLIVDLQKGINYLDKDKSKPKQQKSKLKLVEISLHGSGSLDNLTLATSAHMRHFYDAAEWFVRHQNAETGGWPIPVRRRLGAGAPVAFRDLPPGWHSAMGQGHAISVLARAHHHSGGDARFLRAAVRALRPFRVPSARGGVLALFMGRWRWYEEYPTRPASFVLNGFIYALLGLYDLAAEAAEAAALYREGIRALKGMLPLFDMGSGTAYDLRHVTLGIAPNLARWDYHATHVNQLLLLATIENETIFNETAQRWIGYMVGKRAGHN